MFVVAAKYVHLLHQKLSDYCFEKFAKIKSLNLDISDENIIDCILEGISSEPIKLAARAANFKSIGQLATFFCIMLKMYLESL